MSGLNLEVLHKKLYKNFIKIREIEKDNKGIVDSIKLIETLNKYDDDKLDNLDLQLKEIVNLQKKMNLELTKKVCEGKKDNITNKYLNLPYDINEIIRNKIKKDSELQFKFKHIDKCFKVIESKFQRKLITRIGGIVDVLYLHTYNGYETIENNKNNVIHSWLNLFDELDCDDEFGNWVMWCNRFSQVHMSYTNIEKTKYLPRHITECKKYIKDKFKMLKQDYRGIESDITNIIENIEVDSHNDNYFIKSTTNWDDITFNLRNDKGRKNGMGYKKLLKNINRDLCIELDNRGKNSGEYMINDDTYNKWLDTSFNSLTWRDEFYEIYESNYDLLEESMSNKKYWY